MDIESKGQANDFLLLDFRRDLGVYMLDISAIITYRGYFFVFSMVNQYK